MALRWRCFIQISALSTVDGKIAGNISWIQYFNFLEPLIQENAKTERHFSILRKKTTEMSRISVIYYILSLGQRHTAADDANKRHLHVQKVKLQ